MRTLGLTGASYIFTDKLVLPSMTKNAFSKVGAFAKFLKILLKTWLWCQIISASKRQLLVKLLRVDGVQCENVQTLLGHDLIQQKRL